MKAKRNIYIYRWDTGSSYSYVRATSMRKAMVKAMADHICPHLPDDVGPPYVGDTCERVDILVRRVEKEGD